MSQQPGPGPDSTPPPVRYNDVSQLPGYRPLSQPPAPRPARRGITPRQLIILLVVILIVVVAIASQLDKPSREADMTLRGTGPTNTSSPFTLRGGSYNIAWTATPPQNWAFPTWHLGASIHDPASDTTNYRLLFSKEDVSATSTQSGVISVSAIPPGTYVLSIAAADTAGWTITLSPAH